ncbi:MAG: hypothetical protein HYY24_13640 [Verrucomicrobia bacterium]|nr:hypothetical protein [Verrucomicrobiota bacterium]
MLRHFLLPAFACLTPALADGNSRARATTTVYVGRHFELRDHDQPVKYVFNGATRVARITGSLSTTARVQRLRLLAGWNLCSILVDGAPLPAMAALLAVFRWNPETRDYAKLAPGATLNAGTVLWLKSESDVVLSLLGNYEERASERPVPAGGSFVAGPGLEAWALQLPPGVTVWKFDSATGRWQTGFAGDLAGVSDLPLTLAPGEAIYVHADAPAQLATPDPARRIAYYHQDHLGSSSATTDADGALVEERAFYPSGATRQEERFREVETDYAFSQKERDQESRLDYFEARYYSPVLSRFLSVDPINSPKARNAYAYAANNPVRYVDPSGLEPTGTLNTDLSLKAGSSDVTGSLKLSGSFTDSGTQTTDWLAPIHTRYRTKLSGTLEGTTSLRDIMQGRFAKLQGRAEGQFSYDTEALWTLHVPFTVSARGGVDSGDLSYSGTASGRYRLGAQLPSLGSVSMSFQGRGSSVPEYSLRQYGIGFYPKINAGVLPVPPPEAAFNATQMQWSQGVGLSARYVRQFQSSRLELVAGMGVGLNANNVPQLTYPFARLSYSWGQSRSWSRMPAELAAAAGVP